MDTVVYSSVTPLFEFELGSGTAFTTTGSLNDASYVVTIRQCRLGSPELHALLKHEQHSDETLLHCENQLASEPSYLWPNNRAECFLVTHVVHPASNGPLLGDSKVSDWVIKSALDAVRLHSSKGLRHTYTYLYQSPETPLHFARTFLTPLRSPFSHHNPGWSVLPRDAYAPCEATLRALVHRGREASETLGRQLRLALDCHCTSFGLDEVEHRFLLLMVAFEALFRKDPSEKISSAADRLSKLICVDKDEQVRIKSAFHRDGDPSCFREIRNSTAHGNPRYDYGIVAKRYGQLYSYISRAIVALICMKPGAIDPSKDYYDEIACHAQQRFLRLATPDADRGAGNVVASQ